MLDLCNLVKTKRSPENKDGVSCANGLVLNDYKEHPPSISIFTKHPNPTIENLLKEDLEMEMK